MDRRPASKAAGKAAVTCYATGTDQSPYYNIFKGKLWSLQSWSSQWQNPGGTLTAINCAQDGPHDAALSNVCTATGVVPPAKDNYGQLWAMVPLRRRRRLLGAARRPGDRGAFLHRARSQGLARPGDVRGADARQPAAGIIGP
jgi:hypothetical protein